MWSFQLKLLYFKVYVILSIGTIFIKVILTTLLNVMTFKIVSQVSFRADLGKLEITDCRRVRM